MQSKRQSMIEVGTNTTVGFIGSWIITYLSVALIADKGAAATVAVFLCTVWSLVRGYAIRRLFNNQEGQTQQGAGNEASSVRLPDG